MLSASNFRNMSVMHELFYAKFLFCFYFIYLSKYFSLTYADRPGSNIQYLGLKCKWTVVRRNWEQWGRGDTVIRIHTSYEINEYFMKKESILNNRENKIRCKCES